MAKKLPEFVRISNAHVHGHMADITEFGSLWHISGLEVKRTPDEDNDPMAAAFVRAKMNKGMLEAASEEEYTEQMEAADMVRETHALSLIDRLKSDRAFVQQHSIEDIVRTTQNKIIGRRTGAPVEDEETVEDPDSGKHTKVPAGAGK